MAEYTMQREYKIYDDSTGDYVSVGMDCDALDLVELRYVEHDKTISRITMDPAQAVKVYAALGEYLRLEHQKVFDNFSNKP